MLLQQSAYTLPQLLPAKISSGTTYPYCFAGCQCALTAYIAIRAAPPIEHKPSRIRLLNCHVKQQHKANEQTAQKLLHTHVAPRNAPCSDSQDYSMSNEYRPKTGVAAAQTEACMPVMHLLPAMAKSIEKGQNQHHHAKIQSQQFGFTVAMGSNMLSSYHHQSQNYLILHQRRRQSAPLLQVQHYP